MDGFDQQSQSSGYWSSASSVDSNASVEALADFDLDYQNWVITTYHTLCKYYPFRKMC